MEELQNGAKRLNEATTEFGVESKQSIQETVLAHDQLGKCIILLLVFYC